MRPPSVNFFKQATLILCVMAWLIASNHCALAAMAIQMRESGATAMPCKHCLGTQESGSKTGAPSVPNNECCKAEKVPVFFDGTLQIQPMLLGAWVFAIGASAEVLQTWAAAVLYKDPPRSISFAEQVLQASLPSLAPPARG